MAATNSNGSGSTMPAPAFSYAQAAKGAATPILPATASHAPAPSATSQSGEPDTDVPKPTTLRTLTLVKSERSVATSGETANQDKKSELTSRPALDLATATSEGLALVETAPHSIEGSGRGDDDPIADGSTRKSDELDQTPSVSSSNTQEVGSKDSRVEQNSSCADSEPKSGDTVAEQIQPNEPAKTELVEAPIPTINPWQQRKDAQAAKARHTSFTPASGPSYNENGRIPSSEATRKSQDILKNLSRPGDSDSAENGPIAYPSSTGKLQRKNAPDSSRDNDVAAVRRNGPRGSRGDREDKPTAAPSLPPVQDSAAWPTPAGTTVEDRRQSLERGDPSEKESQEPASAIKKKGKAQWDKLDIPMTYKFETTISHPSSRGRGRGGARGGRDGLSRGSHVVNSTNHAEKRPTSLTITPDSNATNGAEPSPLKANGDTRSRRESTISNRLQSASLPLRKPTAGEVTSSQEKRKHSGPVSVNGERLKDPAFASTQDQYQLSRERSEGKPDRGRGGFRGRGGHQPPHIQTQAPNWAPHNGTYGNRGSQQPYSPPSRHPYGQQYARSNGRGAPRSQQQQPVPGAYGQPRLAISNGTPAAAVPQPGYQFDAVYGMASAATPVPYTTPSYADGLVLNGIRTQIEYWFSVENLLKDLWLRRQMDGQGFVLLSIIATFRRMQAIANDFTLIRMACAESQTLDYGVGDDGLDRVRPRDNWQKWVVPVSEREKFAQNDGPLRFYPHSRLHAQPPQYGVDTMTNAYMAISPGFYTPHGMNPAYNFGGEGMVPTNGHVNGGEVMPETQLSAAVPAFSPRGTADGFGNFEAGSVYSSKPPMDQNPQANGMNGHYAGNGLGITGSSSPLPGANGATYDAHSSFSPSPNGVNGDHDAAGPLAPQGTDALHG